jgi:hypothetical protein
LIVASRFNRYLRGLLGFLDSKVGGLTPADLETSVRPTLDIRPFAYAQAREFRVANTAAIAVGETGFVSATVPIIVPEGELWLVDQFSVNSNDLAAGQRLFIAPAANIIASSGGIAQSLILGDSLAVSTAAELQQCAGVMKGIFTAQPGDELGVFVCQNAVGTPTMFLRYTLMRLTI